MKEWFSAAELAALTLPGMPETERSWQRLAKRESWQNPGTQWCDANPHGVWRPRSGGGGGVEYHYSLLPAPARAKLKAVQQISEPKADRAAVKARLSRDHAWEQYEAAADAHKERAGAKLKALTAVRALTATGITKDAAVRLVGQEQGFSAASFYGWEGLVAGIAREDWLPYLLNQYAGRTSTAEVSPEAWASFLGDYLRNGQPGGAECYERLKDTAKAKGWVVPSLKTLMRKLVREVSHRVIVLRREGQEAHDRLYPSLTRDRTVFHAMQALNYDGHKLDVFTEWPDKVKTDRAFLIAFQDLYSNKIVGWRLDDCENSTAFRLAFGDVIENFGIPETVFSDNTMAAAAKSNTGGTQYRHRYKVKEDDIVGLFPALGIDLRFTMPGHGQSKPIERAFGELSRYISRAPECEGAFTGTNTQDKPANYGQRAIPLKDLIAVVEREINRYNSRVDRDASVAQGRSFDDVFNESYEASAALIRKVTAADASLRRLWLLNVTGVTCREPDGGLELYRNRYWAPFLTQMIGQKVAVRFDPDHLHQPIHVYRLNGGYLGAAACRHAAGFADADAAKEQARGRKQFRRATRDLAEAMEIMSAADVAKLLPSAPATALPDSRVVRPAAFQGRKPVKAQAADAAAQEAIDARVSAGVTRLADQHEARMRRKLLA
jgi:putative transposase